MFDFKEIILWITYLFFFFFVGGAVTWFFDSMFKSIIDSIPLGNILIFVTSGGIADYYFYKFTGVAPKQLIG